MVDEIDGHVFVDSDVFRRFICDGFGLSVFVGDRLRVGGSELLGRESCFWNTRIVRLVLENSGNVVGVFIAFVVVAVIVVVE